jgi:hypothetical protein
MKESQFLVDVERQLKPYTLNDYFNSNHQMSRGHRVTEMLRPMAQVQQTQVSWNERLGIDLDRVADAVSDKSNAQHAIEEIRDILAAYYKVANKRFVDNVFSHQAVHYKFLSGPDGPLRVFSEQWVLGSTRNAMARMKARRQVADRFLRNPLMH